MTEADVYQALNEIGFDKYVEQLQDFMRNYNADREDVVGAAKAGQNRKRAFEGVSVAHRGDADHDMGGQPTMQVKRHRDEVEDEDDEVIDLKTEK